MASKVDFGDGYWRFRCAACREEWSFATEQGATEAAEAHDRLRHVDPLADLKKATAWYVRAAPDVQLREECSRRNLHRASTETLTDDQLRAECERRRLDHAGIPDQWPVVKALKADVARLTKENRDLRNDHARLMMELAGSASVETGPGVVGVEAEKDTAHYVDPVDLLADDV